ncbi:8-amino-7-oxononanoate synthase [Karstenula rhodostoma CBS 690.94]|uniref:8-amino-7-oxononanoate synthase n=1 Tax=Karstenula rhodostoma CBS 690.94 TaxID=1392251 RepID=A0A9P4PUI9_9PLEO|nr:8-amino-7-oxononanoate synthase [Karstenula rhodostoma CBS 690.94]
MTQDRAPSALERRFQSLLEKRRHNATLRSLTTARSHVDFSSNDFLSLTTNPALKSALLGELEASEWPLGSGGSRLLDGNSTYAETLEREICAFHNAEAGLLFNSGFDANAGFFACVPQEGDVVVYDELIHASVHDGMRLSRAEKTVPFRHNSVEDLRRVLHAFKRAGTSGEDVVAGDRHVFVAVEAVYSMDGDVAPLQAIVDTVDGVLGPEAGYVVIDEAHATGVLGKEGRGLVCELGLEQKVFARLHTFGKALGCNGAIILGSSLLRHYLINYARPLIYTTFMSYTSLAAIRTSYLFLSQGKTVPLASNLQSLISILFTRLAEVESPAFRFLLSIPQVRPESPIFSIQLAEPKRLAKYLQDRGMMVRAVVPPTVPEGTSRVRVCLHAGNTEADIERLVAAMEEWCKQAVEEQEAQHVKVRKQDNNVMARL